jgi:hypothetical protein
VALSANPTGTPASQPAEIDNTVKLARRMAPGSRVQPVSVRPPLSAGRTALASGLPCPPAVNLWPRDVTAAGAKQRQRRAWAARAQHIIRTPVCLSLPSVDGASCCGSCVPLPFPFCPFPLCTGRRIRRRSKEQEPEQKAVA